MKKSLQQPSPHALKLASVLATLALSSSAFAADVYLDINGATAGSGLTVAAAASTWDASTAIWSSDSTGSSATAGWSNGDNAIFSAGTDANANVRTLNISAVTVGNLTQEEGRVQLSGGTVTLAGTSAVYNVQTRAASGDYDVRINSLIADSSGGASSITKNGAGILQLSANNTFTGGVTLNQGTLAFGDGAGIYFGTGTLTLAGGNFIKKWGPNGSTEITVANALNVTGSVNVGIVQGNAGNMKLTGTWAAGNSGAVFNVGNTALAGLNVQSSTIKVQGNVSAYTGTFSHNALASGGNRLRFGPDSGGSIVYDASNAKFVTSGSNSAANGLDFADGSYGTFKMGELSGTGGRIRAGWTSAGNTTFEIGALNTSTSYAGNIDNNVNGTGGLAAVNKVGSGTFTVTAAQGYTGGTTVTGGTFLIGASNLLPNSGAVVLNGGTFAIGDGFTDTLGTLDLNANSFLTIGEGSSLIFADSSALDWATFTLTIGGSFVSGSSINFGSSSGLSIGQLSQINIAGYSGIGLDSGGFLTATAIPEPSAFAAAVGALALAAVGLRRRRA